MTEKEKIAAIAFFSNLVDHDAEVWEYANEIPIFKTALEALTANDWTPCAEGMPTEDGEYWVTFMHYGAPFVDKRTFHARTGIWAKTTNVIAWMPKPAPYNPDHIVDTNKKVKEDANDGTET